MTQSVPTTEVTGMTENRRTLQDTLNNHQKVLETVKP